VLSKGREKHTKINENKSRKYTQEISKVGISRKK
jgi:hypothetical protein